MDKNLSQYCRVISINSEKSFMPFLRSNDLWYIIACVRKSFYRNVATIDLSHQRKIFVILYLLS